MKSEKIKRIKKNKEKEYFFDSILKLEKNNK